MKAKSVASAIDASCLTSTQTSIKASPYIAAPYPSRSQRHPEITNAITFHLAKDMCPINTVSNEGINERVNKAYLTKVCYPLAQLFSILALPVLYVKRLGLGH